MSGAGLRIGLIVPANNTTMERELLLWLPRGSDCRTVRIARGKGLLTEVDIPAYTARALALARSFEAGLDAIVYGCTAAAFLAGPAQDAHLRASIAAMHDVPVVSTAAAMVDRLTAYGAGRIGLVSPYSSEVNRGLAAYLNQADIAIAKFAGLEAEDVDALGRVTAGEVADGARAVMAPECDAAFVACSQLPTYDVVDALEAEWGKPVLSSVKATALDLLARLTSPRLT